MTRYSALHEHPIEDEGDSSRSSEPSRYQDPYILMPPTSHSHHDEDTSLGQERENEHADHVTECSSLVNFMETSFRPSIDLSALTAYGLLKNHDRDPDFPASKYVSANHPRRKLWNPIWLTKLVIGAFVVLFVGVIMVVLALYFYSKAHNGLLNGSENLHYAWTYLPTAVFILTTSLWRRVDFYCKELTPYHNMRQGPTPAEQSILLDYIDPILPTSFWKAMKYRHWAVIASLTVYLMLKLCTILSSGLLILTPTTIMEATDSLMSLSTFSAKNLNLADIAADPVDAFYGAKTRGLAWTYGTTDSLTVQTFDYTGSDSLPSAALLTAEVPGISVAMECELATIAAGSSLVPRPWAGNGVLGEYLLANISGTDCELIGISIGQTPNNMVFNIANETTGYQTNYQGTFDYYVCNSGFNYEYDGYQSLPNATSADDYRFLLTMSEVSWYYKYNASDAPEEDSSTSNWTIARSTGVLCKPSYSVDNYSVALIPYNQTLQKADMIPNTSTNLTDFDLKDLLIGINSALLSSTFGQGGADYIIISVPPMFELLAGLNNNSRQEALINPNLLLNLSTQALQGIGAQFAQTYLKQNEKTPLSGFVLFTQQRLQVKRLTVGLLLTTLAFITLATLCTLKTRPWNSVPYATESIDSALTLLAASKPLREHFKALKPELGESQGILGQYSYQTLLGSNGNFTIQPVLLESDPPNSTMKAKKTKNESPTSPRWRPIATRKWFIACLLLVPLIFIGVLEAIQQESDRSNGIVGLNADNDYYHLAASYIPVLLMLLFGAMYHSLDFTVSEFVPFLSLYRGNARADQSISVNFVSKLPLSVLYLSIRNRHWASSFTVIAALMSSFLTIVASGLYSPETFQAPYNIQMQQTGSLNLTHVNLSEDDGLAGTTTKLVVLYNLTYPTWTYDNLVFPTFSAQIPESLLGSNTTFEGVSISMKIPALRPSLECTVAPPNSTSQAGNFYYAGLTETLFNGVFEQEYLEPGVFSFSNTNFSWSFAESNATVAAQRGSAQWQIYFNVPNDTETTIPNTWLGFASPIQWSYYEGDSLISETATDSAKPGLDIDPSVANFGIAAGSASGNKTSQIVLETLGPSFNASIWDIEVDVVVAVCYQILEEVQTTVTFNWPDMSTSEINPPVPDEGTARVIMSNETMTSTWFMDSNTTSAPASSHWFGISLNNFMWALQSNTLTAQTLNAWYTTLENMYDGQPLSELLGTENQDQLLLASSRLYARYAVQAINANMRITGSAQPGQNSSTYTATLSLPVLRLTQNKGPKVVLQVLMGIMVACGAIACLMVYHDIQKVQLRLSPCSVAGKMTLLARSDIYNGRDIIPEGAEWWDNKRRKEEGLFDRWVFSLRWWGEGENRWYGINIRRAKQHKES